MMRKLGLDVILCEERGFSIVSVVVLNGMKVWPIVRFLQNVILLVSKMKAQDVVER